MLKTTVLIKVLTQKAHGFKFDARLQNMQNKTKTKSIFVILCAKQCSTNWHKHSTRTKR